MAYECLAWSGQIRLWLVKMRMVKESHERSQRLEDEHVFVLVVMAVGLVMIVLAILFVDLLWMVVMIVVVGVVAAEIEARKVSAVKCCPP